VKKKQLGAPTRAEESGLGRFDQAGLAMADTPFGPLAPSRAPLLSDRQGFDRRWFAANLQEMFAPTRLDEVATGVGAVVDRSALNQAGYDRERQLFFSMQAVRTGRHTAAC
jgi:hypothetical protein